MPVKSGGSGPVAVVTKSELEHLEDEVAIYYHEVGWPQIDDAVLLWFNVYHTLDLLVAATDPPKTHLLNERDERGNRKSKPNSHLVPAFNPREGLDGLSGWIFSGIGQKFRQGVTNPDSGNMFPGKVIQTIEIDGQLQPLLKHFLARIDLSPDFDPASTLERCRASIADMQPEVNPNLFHVDTGHYVGLALDLIERVWQPANAHFGEIQGWMLDGDRGSEAWLLAKLQIPPLQPRFDSLSADARGKIAAEARILHDINRTTFGLIYDRLADKDDGANRSDGLERAVERLVSSIRGRDAWRDLVAATYGAVAWIIFQQASRSTEAVRAVLQGEV